MRANHITPGAAMWPSARARRRNAFVAFDACHRRILAIVDALEDLVEAIDRDGLCAEHRAAAESIAEFFSGEARAHHDHEERLVFPSLMRNADPETMQLLQSLHADHDSIEEAWMELEPHVQAIATGYGKCDLQVLRQGVPPFAALQRRHIRTEESLIYPAARARLGAARGLSPSGAPDPRG